MNTGSSQAPCLRPLFAGLPGPLRGAAALPIPIRRPRRLLLGLSGGKVLRDLLLTSSGKHRPRVRFHIPPRLGEFVALLDDQPLVALAAALHEDQRKITLGLFAVQAEFQVPARD